VTTTDSLTGERADLLVSLDRHRDFLRRTTRDLTDEQAAKRTTVSELSVGGLIKHVAMVERQWARFIVEGPAAMTFEGGDPNAFMNSFRMLDGETLAGLLEHYEQIGSQTDDLVRTLPGASWSARRTLLHIIAETSQHAGHADIIRESLDGAKTMG
jgi:uncharacterized damage-inducible protein DinB